MIKKRWPIYGLIFLNAIVALWSIVSVDTYSTVDKIGNVGFGLIGAASILSITYLVGLLVRFK